MSFEFSDDTRIENQPPPPAARRDALNTPVERWNVYYDCAHRLKFRAIALTLRVRSPSRPATRGAHIAARWRQTFPSDVFRQVTKNPANPANVIEALNGKEVKP